jgi:hypothetical protein
MELHKYVESGIVVVMPEKERKKLKAEASILNNVIFSPTQVKDSSIFKDPNKYVFLKWNEASDEDRNQWKLFFNDLDHSNVGKMVSASTGLNLMEYTSRGMVVIMPEKERKKLKAEVSVLRRVISHPNEISKFPEIDFRKSNYFVFIGWGDSHEEERSEWRKFHSA